MNFLVNKPKEKKQPNKKSETNVEELPVGFTGSLDDMFGIWKDKPVSLEEIREQQWVRKIK